MRDLYHDRANSTDRINQKPSLRKKARGEFPLLYS